MKGLLAVVCAVVFVAGCGRAPGGSLPSGDYKLYEATTQKEQIAVIDSRSHATERSLPLGTPTRDWKHLYSVKGDTLTDTDPATGATLHTLKLAGQYQLPPATISRVPGGLSTNGHWLVLVLEDWNQLANALPSKSHFTVIDTSFAGVPVRIDLPGYFQFDAVSNDGSRVYLIEYVSGSNYRVRFFDVLARQLDPTIVVDKSNPNESMTGLRLSGVPSPDGRWLYSVYIRPDQGAFIHALSLDGGLPFAFCIDLPSMGYTKANGQDEFHWSLALNANGSRLYAVNTPMRIVGEVDTSGPRLVRIVHLDSTGSTSSLFAQDVQAKEFGANGAVLSADGKTLVTAGATGIMWIDTATLHPYNHALMDWTVWSLALSPDGKVVYALSDNGMIADVGMSSGTIGTKFQPSSGFPMGLLRVEATPAS